MHQSIPCPLCQRKLRLDDRHTGQEVCCPSCKGFFIQEPVRAEPALEPIVIEEEPSFETPTPTTVSPTQSAHRGTKGGPPSERFSLREPHQPVPDAGCSRRRCRPLLDPGYRPGHRPLDSDPSGEGAGCLYRRHKNTPPGDDRCVSQRKPIDDPELTSPSSRAPAAAYRTKKGEQIESFYDVERLTDQVIGVIPRPAGLPFDRPSLITEAREAVGSDGPPGRPDHRWEQVRDSDRQAVE